MQWIIDSLSGTRNSFTERLQEIDREIADARFEIDSNNKIVAGFKLQIDQMQAVIDRFPDTEIAKNLVGAIERRKSYVSPQNRILEEKIADLDAERARILPQLAEYTRVVYGLNTEFAEVTVTYRGEEVELEVR